jgi:hypothetical protein
MKNEIVLYQSDDMAERMEVRLDDETVWLTQQQIVNLFDSSKANISEHIKCIFESGELEEAATVRKFRTVQKSLSTAVSVVIHNWCLGIYISMHPVTPLNDPSWS